MTANKAAAEVRSKIVRQMEQLELKSFENGFTDRWIQLKNYISHMAERASAKKGGLGRK